MIVSRIHIMVEGFDGILGSGEPAKFEMDWAPAFDDPLKDAILQRRYEINVAKVAQAGADAVPVQF